MQISKTSGTSLGPVRNGVLPSAVNEATPFNPLDEFIFSIQDPNAVTRDRIASAARNVFGGSAENTEFIAKLVELMLAVSESRSTITRELVILGGHLQQVMTSTIANQIAKVGDTFAARRKAASLAFDFFEEALQITRSSARGYIRCHQRFANDTEAIRVFSYGELYLLSAPNVTEEQVTTIMAKKEANRKMTREDVADLLKTLQRQGEEIEDRDRQIENIQGLLQDSKTQLDVTQRESDHLRDQLAAHERQMAEKEHGVVKLRELLTERTSGYASMEKELADKNNRVDELTAELKELRNAKPKVETREVPVETLPEAYKNSRTPSTLHSTNCTWRTKESHALRANAQISKPKSQGSRPSFKPAKQ
jgi:hypothetical protein